jgi:hypothetical protein
MAPFSCAHSSSASSIFRMHAASMRRAISESGRRNRREILRDVLFCVGIPKPAQLRGSHWPCATMIAVASGARDIVSDLILPRDLPPADTMAFGT